MDNFTRNSLSGSWVELQEQPTHLADTFSDINLLNTPFESLSYTQVWVQVTNYPKFTSFGRYQLVEGAGLWGTVDNPKLSLCYLFVERRTIPSSSWTLNRDYVQRRDGDVDQRHNLWVFSNCRSYPYDVDHVNVSLSGLAICRYTSSIWCRVEATCFVMSVKYMSDLLWCDYGNSMNISDGLRRERGNWCRSWITIAIYLLLLLQFY